MNGDTQVFQKSVNTQDAHSAMRVDGSTYIGIAFFGALQTAFGSDEAAKWIAPETLFWCRTICGATWQSLLAFKLFRSTSYANHLDAKTAEGKQIDPLKPL